MNLEKWHQYFKITHHEISKYYETIYPAYFNDERYDYWEDAEFLVDEICWRIRERLNSKSLWKKLIYKATRGYLNP